MAKSSYTKQFKKGTMPNQPVDPDSPLNQHEPDSPSKQRKTNSLAPGTAGEARPGLAGHSDYSRKRGK